MTGVPQPPSTVKSGMRSGARSTVKSGAGAGAVPGVEVVEYTDPLCPWAWGAEPVFRALRAALAGRVRWRRVYAVLFDHDDDPPPDPAAETAWYIRHVAEIGTHTLAPHTAGLSRVAASSWPASLVARAAGLQGADTADRVLRRLRESVFVCGEPADTTALALAAARGVPGLDPARLGADAASPGTLDGVRADRAEARRPVADVLAGQSGSPHPGTAKETPDGGHRYALPTLLFRSAAGHRVVPGWRPYEAYASAVEALAPGLLPAPRPIDPAAALERYRSLTGPELDLLTGGARPVDAVRVDTANGPVWLHPEEAATHPALVPPAATGP
ncbi:Predicted dithiol-disulfide isomerase, DsbA family [Streptomyces sp. OspMP-M45]|nr:Predicted dithiol-disulfide isomerase, DsbA family [Streptomyces sp. OspMP-M45]